MATIEDTTERTQLEHERDRNIAFVREIIDHIPSPDDRQGRANTTISAGQP